MRNYFRNLYLWASGWAHFDELRFERGWSGEGWKWRVLYATDYLSHCLTGGACVSWSRWAWDNHETYGLARWLNRLLGERHTSNAGPALWGTKDSHWSVRVVVTVGWLLLIWWW